MEAIIRRTTFDYTAPAMLMMRGADDCAAMTFDIGDSNAKDYSGHDNNGSTILPAFGSTCDGDLAIEQASDGKETVEDPKGRQNRYFITACVVANRQRGALVSRRAKSKTRTLRIVISLRSTGMLRALPSSMGIATWTAAPDC